jgi:Na+-driven multidrug efflux pump
MSIVFVSAAFQSAAGFVSIEIRSSSLTYVRINSFSALSSAIETAVSNSIRTLDKPDVLLVISSIKFAVNIMLDLILISKVHVKGVKPTVNTQATIQLICNMCSAVARLMYFISMTSKRHKQHVDRKAIKTQP